jgi:hypothetical protein
MNESVVIAEKHTDTQAHRHTHTHTYTLTHTHTHTHTYTHTHTHTHTLHLKLCHDKNHGVAGTPAAGNNVLLMAVEEVKEAVH